MPKELKLNNIDRSCPVALIMLQDADAIAVEIVKTLSKRSQGEWMVSYNIKGRYLGSSE